MIVPNSAARNRSLSFTARGILQHLLSLPDGAKEDVRTLADRNPGVGRKGVENAVNELVAAGYYFRRTYRDDSGQVRTEVHVYDTPQSEDSPLPVMPGTGTPGTGHTGTLPTGVKEVVVKEVRKEPSLPSVSQVQTPAAPAAREGTKAKSTKAPKLTDGPLREAARILDRLKAIDTRLGLSRRQVEDLAPLVGAWLGNGATIAEITDAVVQGLPAKVYAPAKIVADRLTRKMPEPRRQWATYADCADGCGRVLPAGQDSGICGVCAGVVPAPFLQELAAESAGPVEPDPLVIERAASIRDAMRAARSAVSA
ncbi:hypothetical protein J7E91_23020 [Streptomyces sp. ISL-99]|nr:hypothetical protein [Streptomyces sp. ISL-99]